MSTINTKQRYYKKKGTLSIIKCGFDIKKVISLTVKIYKYLKTKTYICSTKNRICLKDFSMKIF